MFRPINGWFFAASAVALVTLLGCGSGPEETRAELDPEKAKVVAFWSAQREATRLRLAGEFPAAIEKYRETLVIDSSHEESLYYLGISLEAIGGYAEAEATYGKLLEINPNSGRAIAQLASLKALRAPGSNPDPTKARQWLERSLELNREHSGPILELGRLALDEGRFAEAREHFETAAGYGSAEGRLLAGAARLIEGRADQAAEQFRQVLATAEEERRRLAQGERLEGHVKGSRAAPKGPIQSAAARAEMLLQWTTEPPKADGWSVIDAGLPNDGGRAAWGDADGNGDLDVLVAGPGPARLYRNNGGRFAAMPLPATVQNVWDARWVDFDGDSRLDLYLIGSGWIGKASNRLLRNTGGAFTDVTDAEGLGGERSTTQAVFADLIGDGARIVLEGGADGLRVLRRVDGAWNDVAAEWGLDVEGMVVDLEVADFDDDGRLDVLVLSLGRDLVLKLQQSPGRFVDATGLAGVRSSGWDLVVADFNGDARPDILLPGRAPYDLAASGLGADASKLLLNQGQGRFEAAPSPMPQGFGVMQAARCDGDLVFAGGSLHPERLEPSAVVSPSGEVAWLPSLSSSGVSCADTDGDGRAEIYLAANPALKGSRWSRAMLLRRTK